MSEQHNDLMTLEDVQYLLNVAVDQLVDDRDTKKMQELAHRLERVIQHANDLELALEDIASADDTSTLAGAVALAKYALGDQ